MPASANRSVYRIETPGLPESWQYFKTRLFRRHINQTLIGKTQHSADIRRIEGGAVIVPVKISENPILDRIRPAMAKALALRRPRSQTPDYLCVN